MDRVGDNGMPEKYIDQITKILTPLILAIFGGIAHGLNCPRDKFCLWFFFTGIVLSAFVGMVTYFLLLETGMPESIKSATIAMSGYSSSEVLYLLRRKILDIIYREGR